MCGGWSAQPSDAENTTTLMPVLVNRDVGMIERAKRAGSFQPRSPDRTIRRSRIPGTALAGRKTGARG